MSKIRAQYHFRKTGHGIDAWDVHGLIRLSKDLPVTMVNPKAISDFYENHWYFHDQNLVPSPLDIVEHIRLIRECDTTHPIILDSKGHVMDGMHRICKAVLENISEIAAVQFTDDPEPDYVNCRPEDLPYDA